MNIPVALPIVTRDDGRKELLLENGMGRKMAQLFKLPSGKFQGSSTEIYCKRCAEGTNREDMLKNVTCSKCNGDSILYCTREIHINRAYKESKTRKKGVIYLCCDCKGPFANFSHPDLLVGETEEEKSIREEAEGYCFMQHSEEESA